MFAVTEILFENALMCVVKLFKGHVVHLFYDFPPRGLIIMLVKVFCTETDSNLVFQDHF